MLPTLEPATRILEETKNKETSLNRTKQEAFQHARS
jgi:hypothetical protein